MRRLPQWLLVAALVLTAACASTSGSPPAGAKKRPNVVTVEEIESTRVSDAYDLVMQLRPAWLRTRGPVSMNLSAPIRVYVNGSPMGSVQALRQVNALSIQRMEHLGATEATQRYGTDHANGAILITLR